jgi:threonine synthase
LPYVCEKCGGIFDYDSPPIFDQKKVEIQQGMWKYHHTFELPDNALTVTLGEGQTPLIWAEFKRHKIGFKMEQLNPTGSYKDRGSAVLVSHLQVRGIKEAVEDSSGNAGASFAAYAARAGIRANVYVPESSSGPKRKQIESYGVNLIPIPGERANAANAVKIAAERGLPYASHAYLPFGLMGIATIAYELIEQMESVPGTVVAPVGHGGLLLGIIRGFQALQNAKTIQELPYFVGVQAEACAPIVERFNKKEINTSDRSHIVTIAEGVKVTNPSRGETLLKLLDEGHGEFIAIKEIEIEKDFHELARLGFFVEPTSALVWSAVKEKVNKMPEPIIAILTGSGLKYPS